MTGAVAAPGSARWRWQRLAPYRRLIARRLLQAGPALLGIVLVTFALVNLVPGEAGAGAAGGGVRSGAAGQEAQELIARTYGLDLPVILNLRVQDRGRWVAAALADLHRPARAGRALRRLTWATTLALPELADALAREPDAGRRARLEAACAAIRQRAAPGVAPATGCGAWARALAPWLGRAAVDRAAARLARGEAGARDAVLAAHQRAVPALLARLLAPGSGAASRARLADALSRITGHVVPYDPAAAEAERRSALGQWRDFARAEDLTYRDLGRGERVAAAVTQTRFARWLGRLVRGDFGESLYFRQRAWDVVSARLPVTLGLNLAALLLAYALSLPLGLWSAVRAGRPAERAVTAALFALYALPTYWVALLAVRFLGGIDGPGLFPTSGLHSERPADLPGGSVLLDQLWHAVLPVLCLTYASLAQLTAQARASLVDVLRRDHIRTARAKGLPESTVLWRHAVPGGVLPLVGLLGAQVPYLLSGSVIVETVFDLPGLGSLMLLAIQQRDVNVLMAVVTLTAGLTWLGLLLADLLLLAVDPRIRLEPGRPR